MSKLEILMCLIILNFSLIGCISNQYPDSNYSIAVMNLRWTDDIGENHTSPIEIKLHMSESPIHVDNFIKLAENGSYNGTIFHRIIDDFMIQGGDFTNQDGSGGHAAEWYGYCNGDAADQNDCTLDSYTIPDEADNGLEHLPCTLSMAKTAKSNTGGSQFFIIPEDSSPSHLDGVHTVFGTVTSGCEYITQISEVETAENNRPIAGVTIVSIELQ